MPVIKSSKKRMRQTLKRRERNYPLRSMVKTYFKKELKLIRDKDLDGAVKFMPEVYSIIDTACKKKLLQPNTASRKKSRLARALNELQKGGGHVEEKVEVKKEEPKKVEKAEVPEADKK